MPVMNKHLSVLLAAALVTSAAPVSANEQPAPGNPYMRVSAPNGHTSLLEIASRKFLPKAGGGPAVWLTGVVHIGEPDYYTTLQTHLNEQGLVLYEGAGRPMFLDRHRKGDLAKQERRNRSVRLNDQLST